MPQVRFSMVTRNFYADFKGKDGTNLISQTYDKEKWKKALDAAQDSY
jgi:hypothetical protein